MIREVSKLTVQLHGVAAGRIHKFWPFIESKGSLTSKRLAAGPYPVLDESSPTLIFCSLKIDFN
jgi:hypothetical protein